MKQIKGFSLIEVAIILVIIGVLLSGGITLFNILIKKQQTEKLKSKVDVVYENILAYASINKTLPNSLDDLKIDVYDSGTNKLLYKSATTTDICNEAVNNLLTVDDKVSGHVNNRVAFIVFSRGDNRCNQTGDTSGVNFTIEKPENNVNCIDNTPGASLPYDDIVRYITIDDLRQKICSSFTITTTSLPDGIMHQAYPSVQIEATNGVKPYTFSLVVGSGNLPPGLTLNSNGTISGTPTQAGTYSFTVQAKDSENKISTKRFSITIQPNKPRITTESLPYGQVNQGYCAVVTASGGKTPYTYTVSGLPSGLYYDTNCGTCATNDRGECIHGTPTQAGSFPISVSVTDSNGDSDSKTLTLVINPEVASGGSGGGSGGGGGGSGGGGGGSGGGGSPPTCTLTVSPAPDSSNRVILPYNSPLTLTWSISNGPANYSFSPQSGTCTSGTNSNGGTCQTDPYIRNVPPASSPPGNYTLNVSNAYGSESCTTNIIKICVENSARAYRVWNMTGQTRDFILPNGTCRRVGNNAEITTTTLQLTPSTQIRAFIVSPRPCLGAIFGAFSYYNTAVCLDDNGNRLVNMTGNETGSDR
jgi:type II secretory pathway pseudopilin PulG